jgi:hypothetical protein
MTWEQSSLKYIQDDTDLAESLEEEEGETTNLPLSYTWWASILSLFLAWEDCTSECVGIIWKFGLTHGRGGGKYNFV